MSMLNDAPIPFPRAASQPADALAELFLGDGPLAPEPSAPPTSTREVPRAGSSIEIDRAKDNAHPARTDGVPENPPENNANTWIEALVLGHLPVLASAWVGQYARQCVASAGGCVALLRVRGGTASVDLFGEHDETPTFTTIEDAIRCANGRARRWLVQVDETDEPELVSLEHVAALTLLCGADDAAVVACYRTIKAIGASDDANDRNVRLAIMGASGQKARDAADKLSKASRTFLGREIELVPGATKVSASNGRTLWRAPNAAPVNALVGMLACHGDAGHTRLARDDAAQGRHAGTHALEASMEASTGADFRAGFLAAIDDAVDNPRNDTLEVAAVSTASHMGLPNPMASGRTLATLTPRNGVDMPTRAGVMPSAAGNVHTGELVGLIEGLVALAITCPVAPGVALARDVGGSLHLVTSALAGADLGRAWCELEAAAGWAQLNASLLSAAAAVRVASPTRHLLAANPREARRLLDSGVRVYALCATKNGTPIAGVPLN